MVNLLVAGLWLLEQIPWELWAFCICGALGQYFYRALR